MKQLLSLPSLSAVSISVIFIFLLSPQLMADDYFSSQPPANDNCEDADFIQNSSVSDDIWCGDGTLQSAASAVVDTGNISTPNDNMELFLTKALDSSNAVVWYEFATDSTADWVHIEVDFDLESFTESGMVLFRKIDSCNSLEMLDFSQVNVSGNGIVNSGEVMPNGEYKLMIFGPMEDSLDFDLCLNLSTSVLCETNAPYYYNHAEVFCGLHLLDGYCLEMGSPIMNKHWPACDSCCTLENPQWVVFSTGHLEGEELSIVLDVYECMNNQGVQIAIYDLGCETEFNQDTTAAGLIPEEEMLLTDCGLMMSPQAGVLEITIDSFHSGKVYGLVLDGWSADQCKVDILEILIDGESPEVEGDLSEGIDWCIDCGWPSSDTFCAGAMYVPFCIEGTGVPGICTYTWTRNGEVIENTENQSEIFLDFPEPGDYEICVVANSICGSGMQLCSNVVAYAPNPMVTRDTICMREEYVWEGPYGPLGDGVYGPYNEDVSHLDFSFEDLSVNSVGCQIDAFLELHVIGDNYFNPTELDAVICQGDTYYFPEQGHPEALAFDATGVYGDLPDRDVFISQTSEPGSFYQCDSFFVLDLAVISLDVFGFLEDCADSVFTICTEAPGVIFPDMGLHELDTEFTWEWVRESDGEILASGDNSMGNVICTDLHVSDFLSPEEENLEFRMNAHIDGEPGPDGCNFEVPWTVFLANYLPLTPELESDDVVLIGDLIPLEITNEQFIHIDYHWSFSQEPDTIIGDPNGSSLEVVFSDPGIVEICVYGQNDCASSETHCFKIEIETDVSVPPAGAKKQELEWFPNPVTDALYMRSDTPLGETEIQVYDTRGVLVHQGTEDIGEEFQFSTSDFPSGVYVIRLVFEDGIGVHKMVVQR